MPNGTNSIPSEATASYEYLFAMIAELAALAHQAGHRRIAIHLDALLAAEAEEPPSRRYAAR
jgi:hypothetical protein